jgi:hypothetical protein
MVYLLKKKGKMGVVRAAKAAARPMLLMMIFDYYTLRERDQFPPGILAVKKNKKIHSPLSRSAAPKGAALNFIRSCRRSWMILFQAGRTTG